MGRKTRKVKIEREKNKRAHQVFFIACALLIWFSGISTAGILFRSVYNYPVFSILQITIFIFAIVGIYGIIKAKYPLNYFILISAILNLIFSTLILISGDNTGYLQFLLSILILYLGIRFPIPLYKEESQLNKKKR